MIVSMAPVTYVIKLHSSSSADGLRPATLTGGSTTSSPEAGCTLYFIMVTTKHKSCIAINISTIKKKTEFCQVNVKQRVRLFFSGLP